MQFIVLTALGLIARHALSGVGAALLANGVSPEIAQAVTGLIEKMGPVGGGIVGVAAIAGALGWSYWQKSRSGVTKPPEDR